jgi:hypothetical protein
MTWWHGRSTLGLQLWGVPVLWWGRIGKLAQFAAGLVVLFDLIGAERLRAFGRQSQWWARVLLLGLKFDFGWRPDRMAVDWRPGQHLDWHDWKKLIKPALWVTLIPLSGWLLRTYVPLTSWTAVILYSVWATFAFVLGAALAFLVLYVVIMLIVLVVAVLPTIIVERLLNREQPGHPARWIAFILFLVGFHFDLLAS